MATIYCKWCRNYQKDYGQIICFRCEKSLDGAVVAHKDGSISNRYYLQTPPLRGKDEG